MLSVDISTSIKRMTANSKAINDVIIVRSRDVVETLRIYDNELFLPNDRQTKGDQPHFQRFRDSYIRKS